MRKGSSVKTELFVSYYISGVPTTRWKRYVHLQYKQRLIFLRFLLLKSIYKDLFRRGLSLKKAKTYTFLTSGVYFNLKKYLSMRIQPPFIDVER